DLPFVAGVKAHIGKWMQYLRDWKPVFDDCPQLLPGGPSLATLCQRRKPDSGDLMSEPFEHRDVSRNRMILVGTSEDALQPFSRLGNRFVHTPTELLLDFQQFLPPPITLRNAFD